MPAEETWEIFGRNPKWGKTRFNITGTVEAASKAADDLRQRGYPDVRFRPLSDRPRIEPLQQQVRLLMH